MFIQLKREKLAHKAGHEPQNSLRGVLIESYREIRKVHQRIIKYFSIIYKEQFHDGRQRIDLSHLFVRTVKRFELEAAGSGIFRSC
jgi:hypothetical protein